MTRAMHASDDTQSLEYQNSYTQAETVINEYLDAETTDSCLLFWKAYSESGNTIKKSLAMLAVSYLTPPPTSTDVERRTAVDTLTKERNRLLPDNAEKLLFCHENMPLLNFQY